MTPPAPSARAGIALGSNLGDRLATLQDARDRIARLPLASRPILWSSLYRAAPVGCPDGSPDFLNAVIEIGWSADPLELLARLQEIETALGRVRSGQPNEPRTLDLDLLYLDQTILHDPALILPHPRIADRRFVLEPLGEIRPDLTLPGLRRPISGLLDACDGPPLELAPADWDPPRDSCLSRPPGLPTFPQS